MSFAVVDMSARTAQARIEHGSIASTPQAAAKVATAVLRLEMGNTSRVKWIGTLGEYRIDWGPGYRIYLAQDGNALIVLFGGGTKRWQRDDIRRAEALFSEYKARKAAAARRKGRR